MGHCGAWRLLISATCFAVVAKAEVPLHLRPEITTDGLVCYECVWFEGNDLLPLTNSSDFQCSTYSFNPYRRPTKGYSVNSVCTIAKAQIDGLEAVVRSGMTEEQAMRMDRVLAPLPLKGFRVDVDIYTCDYYLCNTAKDNIPVSISVLLLTVLLGRLIA
ncbi:uncharacterized protein LOC143030532 [Oratosquilla oratoria]|uniref:uncharacterized protein LOC143030532 n=1 Tax=Oratosquilla oratoria TaxID=337810 RepID=UPI003F76D467